MSVSAIIKSTREIGVVLQEGHRVSAPLFSLFYLKRDSCPSKHQISQGRVAFLAGKKLGNAVWRNRAKRVMRSAWRQTNISLEGVDLLIMARSGISEAKSTEVCEQLSSTLEREGLVKRGD